RDRRAFVGGDSAKTADDPATDGARGPAQDPQDAQDDQPDRADGYTYWPRRRSGGAALTPRALRGRAPTWLLLGWRRPLRRLLWRRWLGRGLLLSHSCLPAIHDPSAAQRVYSRRERPATLYALVSAE